MRKLAQKFVAGVVAVLALTLIVAAGPAPSARADDNCPADSGFMGRDVLNVQDFGQNVLPAGQYPNYYLYGDGLYSHSPCQWYEDKYLELRNELYDSYMYVQLSLQASDNSANPVVQRYYEYLAKREMSFTLASAMSDWVKNTEPSAAAAILKQFWEKDLDQFYVAQVYHQLTWHYTFIGEKQGFIAEIYEGIDFLSGIKEPYDKVKDYNEAYEEGFEEFQKYKIQEIASSSMEGISFSHMGWIDSYMHLLKESEKIMYPQYLKINRTAVQQSWMALIGSGVPQ